MSALPGAHRAPTGAPAVEPGIGQVSFPRATRPARASEAMTLTRL